jgi:hypothetical protein
MIINGKTKLKLVLTLSLNPLEVTVNTKNPFLGAKGITRY